MRPNIRCAIAILTGALIPIAAFADTTNNVTGHVRTGEAPISLSTVTLYRTGDQKSSGAVALGSAITDANGFFSISYTSPTAASAVLYMIAEGPIASIRLATVLATAPVPHNVTINERTTVATAFAMAQFIVDGDIGGKSPGLQNASGTFRNLVDRATGNVGNVLGSPPNGLDTSTMHIFNSLANLLAGCVSQLGDCAALFDLATPPGGSAPSNTLRAAVNIAHYPWQNNVAVFVACQVFAPYQPALTVAPETWALALKYVGNGRKFDGPGAMAFDERGDVWVTNNYTFRSNHLVPTCGSDMLLKLTATGVDAPGAPYRGKQGGLDGAGFGITLDLDGDVWVGNFGFAGSTCPDKLLPPANSVSLFNPKGEPLSPRTGFTQGCISSPQGAVSDQSGNIWIANACGGTITRYHAANPNDSWVFDIGTGQLANPDSCPSFSGAKPFDVAINADGNAWVSNNTDNTVFKLSPNGSLILTASGPETGIKAPLGVAVDSLGNVWISNSGIIEIPCATQFEAQNYGDLTPDLDHASVTELNFDGNPVGTQPYKGGGIVIPWGIAVDGNDNIWVANFGGERVTELCGANPENCPPGYQTGQPIAPNGYYSDALVRNTGVSIDPSGNVWVTNNWLIDPIQTNPGGDGLVVFIGLAVPVKTPLIGPPQQP